jgi:DedD protein
LNDILKQRLVGALILVALGVVFWPIIFVEPGGRPEADQARIPPRPEVDTTPIEPPDQVGLRPPQQVLARDSQLEEGGEPESLPQPALEPVPEPVAEPAPQKRTRSESPEKLAMDSQGVPVAWILQVASVSSADKAEQLRQSLLQKDRKAYTRKIRRNGKDLYRVYIGPKFERGRLEAMQAEVDREFGVKSMIVRYIP